MVRRLLGPCLQSTTSFSASAFRWSSDMICGPTVSRQHVQNGSRERIENKSVTYLLNAAKLTLGLGVVTGGEGHEVVSRGDKARCR